MTQELAEAFVQTCKPNQTRADFLNHAQKIKSLGGTFGRTNLADQIIEAFCKIKKPVVAGVLGEETTGLDRVSDVAAALDRAAQKLQL